VSSHIFFLPGGEAQVLIFDSLLLNVTSKSAMLSAAVVGLGKCADEHGSAKSSDFTDSRTLALPLNAFQFGHSASAGAKL
jgi:hypothetical protein